MSKRNYYFAAVLVCFFLGAPQAPRADPFLVWRGVGPVRWESPQIEYRVSSGGFGVAMPETLIGEAVGLWVSGGRAVAALPVVQSAGRIDVSTTARFNQVLSSAAFPPKGIYVIGDAVGTLPKLLYQDARLDLSPNTDGIVRHKIDSSGFVAAVLIVTARGSEDANIFLQTMVHEFGHVLGLGHGAVSVESEGRQLRLGAQVGPAMAPQLPLGSEVRIELWDDDLASLACLYPLPDHDDVFAHIRGSVVFEGSARLPAPGVHIVAVPEGESLPASQPTAGRLRAATVSGGTGTGPSDFSIPVRPGIYRLVVDSSSVQPWVGGDLGPILDSRPPVGTSRWLVGQNLIPSVIKSLIVTRVVAAVGRQPPLVVRVSRN